MGPGASANAGAQDGRLHLQAEPQNRPPVAPRRGEWRVSSKAGDLQGPHHAAGVAQVHVGGPRRGDAAQLRYERGQAFVRQGGLDPGPHVGVPRQLVHGQAAGHGAKVEPRPADQQRHGAPFGDPRQGLRRMAE